MAQQSSKEAKATAGAQIIRPLGGVEKLLSALHLIRQYCAVVVICRYEPSADHLKNASPDVIRDLVQNAIAKTVLENPLLQVVQYNEDSTSPAWRQLAELDMSKHVHWQSISLEDDYEKQLKQTSLKTMDTWLTDAETRPGWDARVFHRANDFRTLDIMFSWNHAHIDGMGAKMFHQQLLHHLSNPDLGGKPQLSSSNILTLPDVAKKFPPPQEELIKYSLSLKFTASTLWQELRPPFLARGNDHSANWCPIRETPMDTAYQTIEVDASAVKKLLALCKQHKTSLTGLIHGLVGTSLSLQLSEKNGHSPQPESFKACTPIDQRRYITSPPAGQPDFDANNTMMNVFSAIWYDMDPAIVQRIRKKGLEIPPSAPSDIISAVEHDLWLIASTVRSEIQQRIDKGTADDVVGLTKFVKDWRSQHKDTARKPRNGSWLVTNIGVVDPGSGPWNITNSSFLNPSEMCSAAFCLTVASVKGGSLTLGVCWQKCVMETSIAEQLVSNLQAWLLHLGSNSKGLGSTTQS